MRVLVRNAIAFGVSALVSLTWTRAMDHLAVRGLIDRKLCRKIVHIGTGCLYMLMWPLYSTKYYASRLLCASIPLAFSAQVTCIGLGLINDSTTVAGMTRTGNKRELLVRNWYILFCVENEFIMSNWWEPLNDIDRLCMHESTFQEHFRSSLFFVMGLLSESRCLLVFLQNRLDLCCIHLFMVL